MKILLIFSLLFIACTRDTSRDINVYGVVVMTMKKSENIECTLKANGVQSQLQEKLKEGVDQCAGASMSIIDFDSREDAVEHCLKDNNIKELFIESKKIIERSLKQSDDTCKWID